MSNRRVQRRGGGRRLIVPSLRYRSRSPISSGTSRIRHGRVFSTITTAARRIHHSPIRRPHSIASFLQYDPHRGGASVSPKPSHATSVPRRATIRSASPRPHQNIRSASASPPHRFNGNRKRKGNNQPHKGLPMPSTNFSPAYEMVGTFIPLVNTPTSTYPKIMQPTYVLSIRPERLEQFSKRMGPWMIHCKRPPCVVGKKLDKNQLLRERTIDRQGGKMNLGEIGCWLSHLKSWQSIAASPYGSGTILEDDASLGTNLQCVDTAMAELKQKNIQWDILFWCHSPIPHVGRSLKPCGLDHWSRVTKNNCMGCIAYTLKKHVAQTWSQCAKPIHNPVDLWVAESFDRFSTYCIKPVLGSIIPSSSDTTDNATPGYLQYL